MKELEILSVNVSVEKGTVKQPVGKISIDESGVVGDAHAGDWHRQISLLGVESFEKFSAMTGHSYGYGDFAENITTRGFEIYKLHPGDRFKSGNVELEITQIGKKCHGGGCAVFKAVGTCVMPKEGIFARVVQGGCLQAGDRLAYLPKIYRISVITISDRASKGIYEDLSGPEISTALLHFAEEKNFIFDIKNLIVADDKLLIEKAVCSAVEAGCDVVITTGGTGVGPKDFTPDVVRPMLDREIPGIMEAVRMKYGMQIPNALLSRSISGMIGEAFVYVLPGSQKAVKEYMTEILKTQEHLFYMRMGLDNH